MILFTFVLLPEVLRMGILFVSLVSSPPFLCPSCLVSFSVAVRSEDVPHQAQARQEAEAEPADPPVVQDAHRQHHPLQRQEAPLEEDQAQAVSQHRLWSRLEIVCCS